MSPQFPHHNVLVESALQEQMARNCSLKKQPNPLSYSSLKNTPGDVRGLGTFTHIFVTMVNPSPLESHRGEGEDLSQASGATFSGVCILSRSSQLLFCQGPMAQAFLYLLFKEKMAG